MATLPIYPGVQIAETEAVIVTLLACCAKLQEEPNRKRRIQVLSLLLCFLLLPGIGRLPRVPAPDLAPEMVERGKKATALVEINTAGVTGTAFCVSTDGYFVTSEHNIASASDGKVRLVLRAGEASQQIVKATVLRSDRETALALLHVEGIQGLSALEMGRAEELVETMPLTAFGYSAGKVSGDKDAYPTITVRVSRITSLQKSAGVLQHIQMDAALNPGNAGGPALDEKGRVVGVIESGRPGTGSNSLTPVSKVALLLAHPEVRFVPPVLTAAHQTEAQTFSIHLTFFQKPAPDLAVTLTLEQPGSVTRLYTARSQGEGRYVVGAVPVPTPSGPKRVTLRLKDGDTEPVFVLPDRKITVGTESVALSTIRSIVNGAKAIVTLKSGKQITGTLTGLEAVETTVSGLPATINFTKTPTLYLADAAPAAGYVSYRIAVRQGATLLAEQTGTIGIEGMENSLKRGMLLVCCDEWPLCSGQFDGQNHDADLTRYILNVAELFVGKKKGHFYIPGGLPCFDPHLVETLQKAGHTVVQSEQPGPLEAYDGVFFGFPYADYPGLLAYIRGGGKVYLSGGMNFENSWNDFLHNFGMEFDGTFRNWHNGLTPVNGSSLFEGVNELLLAGISPIRILPGHWPNTHPLLTRKDTKGNDTNLWAQYVTDPLPSMQPPRRK